MLDVRSVKPYLMMRNSSASLLTAADRDEASVVVLTEDNVAVDTNIDYENVSDVQFTVVRDPVHGTVEVRDVKTFLTFFSFLSRFTLFIF